MRGGFVPKTREVVCAAIIAALYAVFTVALAPLSYGPLQFRIAEILKGLVIWYPVAIPGIVLGTIIANLTSPYVGAWELVWMPITDGLGGVLAWMIARALGHRIGPWLAVLCYALTTGAAVGLMLSLQSLQIGRGMSRVRPSCFVVCLLNPASCILHWWV